VTLNAAALLEGPRGRRLCLAFLIGDAIHTHVDEVMTAVFWAIRQLDPNPGTTIRFGAGPAEPDPVVTPEEAADMLGRLEIPEPTAERLRDALGVSVDHAMYWQEPDGSDVFAATGAMHPVLARVAEVIAAAPDAAWWASSAALSDQWAVSWEDPLVYDEPGAALRAWTDGIREDEERSARERPADPSARWSGTWWSTPPTSLVHTTRSMGAAGPAELWFIEDSFGWDTATTSFVHPASARVLEIEGPEAWADLCRRHPLDVTASRRHDWYRVTGRDGRWVQPDWESVAREADGVHLSVGGYLRGATRLIPVDDERASVIGGWAPDATYWLARPLPGGIHHEWHRTDTGWRRT